MAILGRRQPFKPIIKTSGGQPSVNKLVIKAPVPEVSARRPSFRTQVINQIKPAGPSQAKLIIKSLNPAIEGTRQRFKTQIIKPPFVPVAKLVVKNAAPLQRNARPAFKTQIINQIKPPQPSAAKRVQVGYVSKEYPGKPIARILVINQYKRFYPPFVVVAPVAKKVFEEFAAREASKLRPIPRHWIINQIHYLRPPIVIPAGRDANLLHRVTETTSPGGQAKIARFTEITSQIVNSLVGKKQLIQTGPSSYSLANVTPPIQAGLTPGSYTSANITVNSSGVITAVTSGGTSSITLTGDVTGSGSSPIATTLASVITAGGPIGDSTHTPVITWDAKGRLTAVSSAAISGGGGGGGVGNELMIPVKGISINVTSSTSNDPSVAMLYPITIPCPMYIYGLGCIVNSHGSGTQQWGLFDFHSSPTSATLLAGGSGVIGGNGYQIITATSQPVLVSAGAYALIFLNSAVATNCSFYRTPLPFSIPYQKFQGGYTWTNTPDITTGWTTDSVIYHLMLHGNIDATHTW